MTKIAVAVGKTISFFIKLFRLGAGVTWAGEIGLKLDPDLIRHLVPHDAKVILIAGTNGKTTTTKLLTSVLPNAVTNKSGANLLNGIAGTLIQSNKASFYIFEVDENNLPKVLNQLSPSVIVLTNLFRDQLDRYGEVDNIAKRWQAALTLFDGTLILNADDPQLAALGQNLHTKVKYFGLNSKKYYLPEMQHATDSIYCPSCGSRLNFLGVYFSHLGKYKCPECSFAQPELNLTAKDVNSPLEGVYNIYNTMAAVLTAKELGIKEVDFTNFKPAFGRGEKVGNAKILLSKNPAGFNESLRTVAGRGSLLLVLNDRIPDGTDISWIWDVDFEILPKDQKIFVWGDRKYDLAVRLKYAELNFEIAENYNVDWILPTYSAMLDIRKKLLGKKIL